MEDNSKPKDIVYRETNGKIKPWLKIIIDDKTKEDGKDNGAKASKKI